MMMGLCDVTKEGEFSIKGDPRVLYSVMMAIRMQIVQYAGIVAMSGVQIAMRYCSVRRQFSTVPGNKDERKVIDYQTTQTTLGKLLTKSFIMSVVGDWTSK